MSASTEGTGDATDDGDDDSGGAADSTGGPGPSDSGDDQTTLPGDTTSSDETGDSSGGGTDVCGDGIVGPTEACDGTEFDDASCASLGFMSGDLVCSDDCSGFSTEGCYVCGDGEVQGAEQCDTVLDDDITCESEGFTAGEISCDFVTCQYDTSQCSLCGNGIVEGDELCDSDDLGGQTCVGLGFESGELACAAESCGFDYVGCAGGMYIQNFEGGAIPGEFATSGDANWSATTTGALSGSWSAVSGDIGNNQVSTITLEALFSAAGNVEFAHAQSTEDGYDYLRFYIDGVMQDEWDGVIGSTPASYPVTAGMHTLVWSYEKDISLDEGSDQVWIDDVVLTNGAPTL
ncbi:MAG TPA: hypothetical protein VFG69_15045 [Nannocystaceae bacterium]|nr:hypothetical protein [Nannocystaceae bacterium]